jgi:DNA-directed RNA polymerase omega subunit
MSTTIAAMSRDVKDSRGNDGWPGIFSRFQLVILAGLRSKQLLNGARPRIVVDSLKRKNTVIALEELRRGLIIFNTVRPAEPQKQELY